MKEREGSTSVMSWKKSVTFSAVTLIFTVAALLWIMRGLSPSTLWETVRNTRFNWLLSGFGLMLLYVALEGLCMYFALRVMKESVSLKASLRYAFVGFYFSGITPSASGGQPVQVYCMGKDGINGSCAALCLLLISGVYQMGMLLYGGTVLLLQRGFLIPASQPIKWLLALGAGWNLLLVTGILFLMFSTGAAHKVVQLVFTGWERCFGKKPELRQRLQQWMEDYRRGAVYIRQHWGTVIFLMGITVLRLTILYAMPWFVARAFGLSGTTAIQLIGLSAILTLAVSSLPLPGAAGASESVSALLFGMVFSSGLLAPAVLLMRGLSFYGVLCVSAAATMLQFRPSVRLLDSSETEG